MKHLRNWWIWAALTLCAVMVLAVMSWLTAGVLRSENDRAAAEARADLEARSRLALWRMDAVGAAVLLGENQRPPAEFQESPAPSPVPPEPTPWVNLHFEVRFGHLVSPEVRDLPEKKRELDRLISRNGGIKAVLHGAEQADALANQVDVDTSDLQQGLARLNQPAAFEQRAQSQALYQEESNVFEKAQRAKVVAGQQRSAAQFNQRIANAVLPAHDSVLNIGHMRAVWIGKELFLLRYLVIATPAGQSPVIQGVWLDAANLQQHLLESIADLLPGARLEATLCSAADAGFTAPVRLAGAWDARPSRFDDPMALVSFPFRLIQPPAAVVAASRVNQALVVGWAAVLAALLTALLLVRGVMRLSERRASFVSAVTHELRTPLTTFRLYSDMLDRGAVKEEKRGDYLRVLSREADRLSHLVENVLAFSRIERGNARSHQRELSVAELLENIRDRLEARLATAGLDLALAMDTAAATMRLRLDTAAVEHITFNLIDNAAKYAAAGDPRRVELGVRREDRMVAITVRDHGPGVNAAERSRIFRPFHKSAREAAESQPGVGLGLALSRRLARSLGGTLDCGSAAGGAEFILRLPVVGGGAPAV